MFSSIEPLLRIYRPHLVGEDLQKMYNGQLTEKEIPESKWILIYESPKFFKGGSVSFGVVNFLSNKLYGESKETFLKFVMLNHKNNGDHKFKGHGICRVNELRDTKKIVLTDPLKARSCGFLNVSGFNEVKHYGFVDYLYSGMNMNLFTCIDFTASNMPYNNPSGLHYNHGNDLNQYQRAIVSVVDVLQNYDYDKMIQTFGFGGIPRFQGSDGLVSHFFPCSGNPMIS